MRDGRTITNLTLLPCGCYEPLCPLHREAGAMLEALRLGRKHLSDCGQVQCKTCDKFDAAADAIIERVEKGEAS